MNYEQFWFAPYGNLVSGKNKNKFAELQNNIEFQNVFNTYINLRLDNFEWKNLPKTCSAEVIEKNLLWRGTAAFYQDEVGNVWTYGAGIGGKFTRNGKPSEAFLYALDGTHIRSKLYWEYMDNTDAKAVLIEDNPTRIPIISEIIMAALNVSDAKRTLQVASRHFKIPYIIQCSEEQARSVEKIYNDVQNNKPLILLHKGNDISEDETQVMSSQLQAGIIKELWDYYKNIEDDSLKNIGVQVNQNNDKKERMSIIEVKGDTSFIQRKLDYQLEKRKEAAKRANEAFGLNIEVDFKHKEQMEQGGNENETIQQDNN